MNSCCQSTQRIDPSPKSAVRRKRPRPSFTTAFSRRSRPSSRALLVSMLSIASASAYTVTWNFGPEDHFFCGHAWDDYNCSTRQNCRSGKSEECIGFSRGETCFKDTPCDSASGGGHEFSEDLYDTDIPTFNPTIYQPQPTEQPQTTGPTLIPTDVPIGPPPDFDWPSDDPSDHWFCGVGIDDANEKCGIHCPKASECPMGQIVSFWPLLTCFFVGSLNLLDLHSLVFDSATLEPNVMLERMHHLHPQPIVPQTNQHLVPPP